MARIWQQVALVFFLMLFAISSITCIILTNAYIKKKNSIIPYSLEVSKQAAIDAARGIDQKLSQILIAKKLASEIKENKIQSENLETHLIHSLEMNEQVTVLMVLNAPEQSVNLDVIDETIDISLAFQVLRKSGWYRAAYSNDEIPVDLRQSLWLQYRRSLIQQEPVWSQMPTLRPSPFSFTKQKNRWWFGGFTMPYRMKADPEVGPGRFGVVAADITLNQIRQGVFSVISGTLSVLPIECSYAFIVSKSGHLMSHPNQNYVVEKRHIRDFAPRIQSTDDIETKLPAIDATRLRLLDNHHNTTSGQNSWVFFAPIESEAGWWVAIVIDKQESRSSDDVLRWVTRYHLAIVLTLLIALFALAALVFQAYRGQTQCLWSTSHALALLCMMTVIYLWYVNFTQRPLGGAHDILLLNRVIAAKVGLLYTAKNGQALLHIPTGVYVQSIEFTGANKIVVSGYLWQKYADRLPAWVRPENDQTPGFILPEAESSDIELVYHDADERGEVFGWRFAASLRQEFEYSRYPFDHEQVWLRIWHAQIGQGVILTPDFDAYHSMRPESLPGLGQVDFVLEGWTIIRSFFSYRRNSYNTNFGRDNYVGQQDFPELYYNIDLRRNFLNAFVSHFIPLMVASLLSFSTLLMIRCGDKVSESSGFDAIPVLALCAALFFSIVVAHASLRNTFASQQVVYFEYFYFINYTILLSVSANALMASLWRLRFMQYQNNLIMRLVYWPYYWMSLLFLTLLAFYM